MKPTTNFRTAVTILIVALVLFFLENKRQENRKIFDKAKKGTSSEANKMEVSNTDYIFFESLTRYLFISMQQ